MLVLSRKIFERIVITTPTGERITIQVVAFRKKQDEEDVSVVRLGIAAPNNVAVHREEVQNVIDAEAKKDAH